MSGDVKTQVAITGMGVISSIGNNCNQFGQSLRVGKSGIRHVHFGDEPAVSVNIGAAISGFSFEALLQPYLGCMDEVVQKAKTTVRRAPYVIQCSVLAALEAWLNSGLHKGGVSPERIGIIVAGSNLSHHFQYQLYPKFRQTPEYLSSTYALHYMDTDQVGVLSEIFGINGEGFTVGGASASGNVGIIKGFQLIKHRIVDVCLVIGALADLSPMEIQGFYNIGAMGGKRFFDAPEKACRPFDTDHEGFIYGQASGCLVLEAIDSAQKRNVPVLAEMAGGVLVLDGNHLSDPSENGEVRAMESALQMARLEPSAIDYINTHGTSSPIGDETEIRAIRKVFQKNLSKLPINATKGLTGHCLYSAGVIEAIATIIQMKEKFLHPNINLDNPIDKECCFCGPSSTQSEISAALSNSFGFGGINTSIIFKRPN